MLYASKFGIRQFARDVSKRYTFKKCVESYTLQIPKINWQDANNMLTGVATASIMSLMSSGEALRRQKGSRIVELITLVTKTRGRNSRDVQYQGIGRIARTETEKDGKTEVEESVVTDGTLTTFEDAVSLPGIDGNVQKALDLLAIGYNKFQRDAALDVDEFAGYISAEWDEDKVSAFKRSVRALAKVAEIEVSDAAEMVLSKMNKTQPVEA